MGSSSQGGSGSRKFGRNARGGASAKYKSLRIDLVNKAKRIAKQAKAVAKAKFRKGVSIVVGGKVVSAVTSRGFRRAQRRTDMVVFNAVRKIRLDALKNEQKRPS